MIQKFYLILALFIGFMVMYSFAPVPKKIKKYPNLENSNSSIYIDDNDVCYKYIPTIVECDK